jgi:hypothetical protein
LHLELDLDDRPSIYAGMSTTVLQQALANAQAALIALQTGSKGVSFSYTQGDGAKTVTYTPANIGDLTALIRQLQQQLGIIRHARRPIRFVFR